MDVRCERCRTEYEFDETYLTDVGVAVKCTTCGHVFKVRRQPTPAPEPARAREWKIRRRTGELSSLSDLGELQRWIVERRVGRDDEVSLSGEAWRTLGSMPELASFFQVVEAAAQAQLLAQQQASGAPTRVSPPRAFEPAPAARQAVGEPAWAGGATDDDDDVDDRALRQAVRPSRAPLFLGLFALVAAGGGVTYFLQQQQHKAQAPKPTAAAQAAAPLPPAPPVPPAASAAAVPAPAAPPQPAAAPAPPAQAGPAPAPAVAPKAEAKAEAKAEPKAEAKAEEAKAEPGGRAEAEAAGAKGERPARGAGHDFNWYLGRGHKLLDNRPKEALAMFEEAARVDPTSPEPDSGRGLAYTNLEQWEPAITAFQAALKKSPEFTEAMMGLAEAYRYSGAKEKAIKYYKRYLDLTPDGPDAPVAKAQIEALKGS